MAVAPFGNLQQQGRVFVPTIDIDKDWEPLPVHFIHDDEGLKKDPVKLGQLYAREWFNR